MKVQCSKEAFLNGIQQVQNIVASKTTTRPSDYLAYTSIVTNTNLFILYAILY